MKTNGKGLKRSRVVLAVAAVGVFSISLMLHGAPPGKQRRASVDRTGSSATLRGGPGIPQEIPVGPPITVDYRKDPEAASLEVSGKGRVKAIGEPVDAVRGTVAGPPPDPECLGNEQCADCNPCTMDICCSEENVALFDECTIATWACIHVNWPDDQTQIGCDDGIHCNGLETCQDPGGGAPSECTPGTEIDCEGQVCYEGEDEHECRPACTENAECDDGLKCTDVDSCNVETGVCSHTDFCRLDGVCIESQFPQQPPSCARGRCCVDKVCEALDVNECKFIGGLWLALPSSICIDLDEDLSDDVTRMNDCPDYGSGIAEQGTFFDEIGAISELECDTHRSVGDDYKTNTHGENTYMYLDLLRFAGRNIAGSLGGARWSIELRDIDGVFIEDVFWPDGTNDIEPEQEIKTVDFDPPLVIPTEGFVVWTVQENFGADGRVALIPTDTADVGTNDAGKMWYNGAILTGGGGPLPAGERVLAFELVGNPYFQKPLGACCRIDGSCDETLPWICLRDGDVFQGIDSFCGNVCANDPFRDCTGDADCYACSGGEYAGWPCDCPSGTCTGENDTCEGGPNAGGDCDPLRTCGAGTCTGTSVCALTLPTCSISACCDDETGDCVETTKPEDAGSCIGTVCDNNPVNVDCENDGDCPGGSCVDVTGYAYQGYVTSCDPDCCEQPLFTGADRCSQADVHVINVPAVGQQTVSITITGNNSAATCDGPFSDCDSPIGGTCPANGPTWWESFSIDDCANVRLDMCCSDIGGEPLRPAWGGLWAGCPCPSSMGDRGVEPPIGLGRDTEGFARGGPFCNEDNLWMTFGPLRKGRYNYTIYGASDGTSAVPPGVQYQLHVTVGACARAACCLSEGMCAGVPTSHNVGGPCDDNSDCCFDWSGGQCQDDAPGTCTGGCEVLNEIECADEGGYWLAYETIPDTMGNVISCSPSNPCEIGSCCTGPGLCEDRSNPLVECDPISPATCMTKKQCDGITNGEFTGGGRCDYPGPPCPICTLAAGFPGQCQLPGLAENAWVILADLSMPPSGITHAEDFVPDAAGAVITTVCAWGVYLDGTICDDDGNAGCDCSDTVTDNFRVTVYEDAGGYPGNPVPTINGTSNGTSSIAIAYKGEVRSGFAGQIDDTQMYEYQFVLATPIFGMTLGERYWLEIVNNTCDELEFGCTPESEACNWHMAISANRYNDYSVAGTGNGYIAGTGNKKDTPFCLDIGIGDAPPVEAACCLCGSDACSPTTVTSCPGTSSRWDVTDPDCAGGSCPAVVEGDLCANAIPISGDIQVAVTTLGCATQDGPAFGGNELVEDVWFAYTATCTGRVTINMCGTGNSDSTYDSAFAVYDDSEDSTRCPCPDDPTARFLGDDTAVRLQDEGCTGYADGGSGWYAPPTRRPGDCLMIRIAGYGGDEGRAHFSVGCEGVECFDNSSAPVHDGSKNRYLSIKAGNVGRSQAIRVIFEGLPPPWDAWNDVEMWVQEPQEACESGGKGLETPPGDCPASLPRPLFWTATLDCSPHYRKDWATDDKTIHVRHEGIVPSGRYNIQVIDETCLLDVGRNYSPSLIVTNSVWGDMCGPTGGACVGPPDGVTDVANDVLGCLDKFAGIGMLEKASADIDPSIVDVKVNVAMDVLYALDAFQVFPYPFAPSGPPPCAAPAAGLALGGDE